MAFCSLFLPQSPIPVPTPQAREGPAPRGRKYPGIPAANATPNRRYSGLPSRSGGTGRRAGLKIRCLNGRVGSSPTFGTRRRKSGSALPSHDDFRRVSFENPSGPRLSIPNMYTKTLAQRIRELVSTERSLSEKKMFGGLAFLVNGNMAVAASAQGGVLVRVDPDESERLLRENGASLMEMRGRTMAGWMRVDADAIRTKDELSTWVDRGVSFARSLPAKP